MVGLAKALGWLYHSGLRVHRAVTPSRKLPAPVLSVGNLAVGGRGKTPFVIALAQHLKQMNFEPVVLTRGYGRSSKASLTLHRDQLEGVDANMAGDEPLEICLLAQCPVVVNSNRHAGGLSYWESCSVKSKQTTVFLLDDGFQHWALQRLADWVLVSNEDRSDRLLPLGKLREPWSSLSRAMWVWEEPRDFQRAMHWVGPKPEIGKSAPHLRTVSYLTSRARVREQELVWIRNELGAELHLELCSLPDHASSAAMQGTVESFSPRLWLVGWKEAVKLFSPKVLAEWLDEGCKQGLVLSNGNPVHVIGLSLQMTKTERLLQELKKVLAS